MEMGGPNNHTLLWGDGREAKEQTGWQGYVCVTSYESSTKFLISIFQMDYNIISFLVGG